MKNWVVRVKSYRYWTVNVRASNKCLAEETALSQIDDNFMELDPACYDHEVVGLAVEVKKERKAAKK